MSIYTLRIYQKNWLTQKGTDGTFVAELPRVRDVRIERGVSRPDHITFDVPREDGGLEHVALGRIVRVLKDSSLVSSGVIVGPLDKDSDPYVTVTALGKAELLNWHVTPWNFELKTTTPASQVNELLKEYRFFRQNTYTDFSAATLQKVSLLAIAESTVKAEDDWWVTLATVFSSGATAVYRSSGTLTCSAISLGSPSGFNRLRYHAELGNATDIRIQMRYAPSTTPGTPTRQWTAWQTAQQAFLEDQQTKGVEFSVATPFEWIQPRFLLTTTNTLVSPALRSFEVVAEYTGEVSAGSLLIPTLYQPRILNFVPHLRGIRQICEETHSEFEVTGGYTLHIRPQLGDQATSVLLHEDRNTNVTRYVELDETLGNALWAIGSGNGGLDDMVAFSEATTSQRNYGVRHALYPASGTTLATVQTQASSKLSIAKDPALDVQAEVLSVPLPTTRYGNRVRFFSPARDVDRTLRVMRETLREDERGEVAELELTTVNTERERGFSENLGRLVPRDIVEEGEYAEETEAMEAQRELIVTYVEAVITGVNNSTWDNTHRAGIDTEFVVLRTSEAFVVSVTDEATPTSSIDTTLAAARIQVAGGGIVPYDTTNGSGCYLQARRTSGSATLKVVVGAVLVGYPA